MSEHPRLSIAVGFAVSASVLIVFLALCLALLFTVGAGLVWLSGMIATWLGLPRTDLLIAVVGLAACLIVVMAYTSVGEAVRQLRRALMTVTSELLDYDGQDGEHDEDDESGDWKTR